MACAILAFLFLCTPAVVFGYWVRQGMIEAEADWRQRTHHCLSCGYFLRGNTTGRCSECGALEPVRRR